VNKKIQLYRKTDVHDNGTFKVPISDLNFRSKIISVRFSIRRSAVNVDKRIRCDLSLKDIECPICFQLMKNEISMLCCGHSFCTKCVINLQYCSICRLHVHNSYVNKTRNYKLEEILGKIMIKELGKK